MIPTDILNLVFVKNKITHGLNYILTGFMYRIPNTEFSIIGPSSNLHMIISIPLECVSFSLMSF